MFCFQSDQKETQLFLFFFSENFHVEVRVPVVPSLMVVSGSLNVSYRIFVAGRSNIIHVVKDGILLASTITVPAAICAIQVQLKSLYIACIDHRVYVRAFKGQVGGVLELPAAITAMTMFQHPNSQSKQVTSTDFFYKQNKNRNETGSNLSLGTRLTVLSKTSRTQALL